MTSSKSSQSMRVRVTYKHEYMSLDIGDIDTVRDIKEIVRQHFYIGPDGGAAGLEGNEKKILTLYCAGSALLDHWYITDLGISPGATIKAVLVAEVKPVLYIYNAFNEETVPIIDKIPVPRILVADVRALTTRKTGIPVGVFRLTYENKELYDCHSLDDYGIDVGDTLRMETWDGWNEFLNVSIVGYTSQVLRRLSSDEVEAKYQMKVALYIAAHFGHVDLAVSLMRQGIRADEPVGDHPLRLWCRGEEAHIDSRKAPVHEASESGQIGVLRAFVNHNVCNVLARDGNDLTPLNIALRKKQKACASFLLTKQWSKINYTEKSAIPLSIYVKIKRWGDRSKDRVLLMHGQWKSSIKNPRRHGQTGALLSNGVQLDGFTKSKLNSKNSKAAKLDEERERRRKRRLFSGKEKKNYGEYDAYFKALGSVQSFKLPKVSRLGRSVSRNIQMGKVHQLQVAEDARSESKLSEASSEALSQGSDAGGGRKVHRPRSSANSITGGVRLPPIKERIKGKQLSSSQHNLTTMEKSEGEAAKTKPTYIQTGGGKRAGAQNLPPGKLYRSTPSLSTPSTSESLESKSNPHPGGQGDPIKHGSPTKVPPIKQAQQQQPTEPEKKKKRERKISSAAMIAKAKTADGSIPLPTTSVECSPKPFFHDFSGDIPGDTLALYERYRGYKSRDYAIRCLTIANSFSEKPWLQQVRQAVMIARQGVKKTVSNKPTIFAKELQIQEQKRLEQKKLSAGTTSRRKQLEPVDDVASIVNDTQFDQASSKAAQPVV